MPQGREAIGDLNQAVTELLGAARTLTDRDDFGGVVRIELEGGWIAYVTAGSQPGALRMEVTGLLIVPAADLPVGGLTTRTLQQSFAMREAADELMVARLQHARARFSDEPATPEWKQAALEAVRRTRRRRIKPRERVDEEWLFEIATLYMRAVSEHPRRPLQAMCDYLRGEYDYGTVNRWTHQATTRGLLPSRGRGVIAREPTERWRQMNAERAGKTND